MICDICKEAGRKNAEGKVSATYLEFVHSLCRGGTWCDCQHVTGPTLGTDMM